MDAQIHACPTVDQRPGYEADGKQSLTHQQREEQGYRERVWGMSWEETVVATTIAIDHIDKTAYLWVMRGSPTGHKGFDNLVIDGACQQYTEACRTEYQQHVANITVGTNHHIEQRQIEWYPRLGIGQRHYHPIEEGGVAAVHQ